MTPGARLWLVSLFSLSFLGSAPTGYGHPYQLDKKFEFGRLRFGADVSRVPAWAVRETCSTALDGFNDCSLFDADGIEYALVSGEVCSKTFVMTAKNREHLPYGIDAGQGRDKILAALTKRLGLKFTRQDNGYYASDHIAPDVYDTLTIFLKFDTKGKIVSVELWSNAT